MKGQRFVLAALMFLSTVSAYAKSQVPAQPLKSHDTNAVIERKTGHMTHQQRIEAAKRLRASRMASDPAMAARIAETKQASDRAIKARIAALQNPTSPDSAARIKTARDAQDREAQARSATARESVSLNAGGSNE